MLLFAPLGGRLCQRYGPKPVQLTGLVLVISGFSLLLAFHTTGTEMAIAAVVIFAGVAFLLTSVSVSVLTLSPRHEVGSQTGLNTSFRTIGQAVGVSFAGAFLATFLLPHSELPSDAAYLYTCVVAILLAVAAIGVALTLPRLEAPVGATAPAG